MEDLNIDELKQLVNFYKQNKASKKKMQLFFCTSGAGEIALPSI